MDAKQLALALAGAMLTILLGVGTLLRADIDRLDDRMNRTAEYVVQEDAKQNVQINANTKRLALIERELKIWLQVYRNDPARDEANQ